MSTQETKRIHVGKSDEAAAVAEKLIDSEAATVIVTIPKFAKICESLTNFHLLKREAEVLKKTLIVESIDDAVAALCRKAGLEFQNPFFSKPRRQFSDIVVAKTENAASEEENAPPRRSRKKERQAETPVVVTASSPEPLRRKKKFPVFLGVIIASIVIVGGGVAAVAFLPRATIAIVLIKEPWAYQNNITAAKSLTAVDAASARIPGQIFSQRSNFEMRFPASGREQISRRATGRILIWNAYGSEPQPLVERTRFQTPEGKIFRLIRAVTVPGAKIVEGKVVPSSIEAEVAADEPGVAYNSDPVIRFTVPGFAGTPKAAGFYAESKTPLAGGFIGEAATPTKDDIAKGRKEITEKLDHAIATAIRLQLPKEFTLLDDAKQFAVLRENVETLPGEDGTFSIFMEAESTVMVFREEDVRQFLSLKAKEKIGEGWMAHDDTLRYGELAFNLKTGELSIAVDYQSRFAKAVDESGLKAQIAGKTERDLSTLIASLPGLERSRVTLWPFWVRAVPEELDRISLTVD